MLSASLELLRVMTMTEENSALALESAPTGLAGRLRARLDPRSAFWRRLAYFGATRMPQVWVRYSPPLFGLAFASLMPRQRRRVRDNLRLLLGDRGAAREMLDVARTFTQYSHCVAESLGAGRPEGASASGEVRGAENMREALARGRGVVLLTAHTGGWDLGATALRQHFELDVALVMASEASPEARRLHDEVRGRYGVRIFHVGEHPTQSLPLLRQLRSGGAVAIQLDRAPPGAGALEVRAGGASLRVPRGPFQLASLAKAPLLPVFMARAGYFNYSIEAFPLIDVPARPGPEALEEAATSATESMLSFLRRYPTQWFHFSE